MNKDNELSQMNRAGQTRLSWTTKTSEGEYLVDMTDFESTTLGDTSEDDRVVEMMTRLRLDQLNQSVTFGDSTTLGD